MIRARESGPIRLLHPPRTGTTSIAKSSWRLGPPEYYGHALPLPGERFRYGFTRNPWDRVVSLYHLLHPNEGRPFDDWVMEGMPGPAYEGIPIVSPTTVWLDGANFIGRFESRAYHLELLARLLGRPVPELHHGATERRPYTEYYDDHTRQVVALRFAPDLERFGYRFDQ